MAFEQPDHALSQQATEVTSPDRLGVMGEKLRAVVDLHPALKDVRAMKEFKPKEPGWLDDFLKQPWVKAISDQFEQAMEGALKALRNFLGGFHPPVVDQMPTHLANLLTGIVSVLLSMLALYAFYLLLSYVIRSREARTPKIKGPIGETSDNTLLVNAAHHEEQAQNSAGTGDFAMAARQLYYAALCLLDESGLLAFEKTRTNYEYAQTLGVIPGIDAASLQGGFRTVAGAFEAVRYGEQPLTASGYELCRKQYETIRAESAGFARRRAASAAPAQSRKSLFRLGAHG